MLGGTFPTNNIAFGGNAGDVRDSNPTVNIGSKTFRYGNRYIDADYIINRGPCWTHTDWEDQGITCALKNMMTIVAGVGAETHDFHNTFTTENYSCWGALLSNAAVKSKQVLVLTDATAVNSEGGPGGGANAWEHKIIATRDVVANDYLCTEILRSHGMDDTRYNYGKKVVERAALAIYALGTNDPNQMDVVEISPPYPEPVAPVKPTRPTGLKVVKQ
jgi:uncharacterized protein (DUF362 family)